MRLYLMQHAEAKNRVEDPKRGLTDAGIDNILKISAYLADFEKIKFTKIYHSNKKRACDTAKILADNLNYDVEIEKAENLGPNGDVNIWINKINDLENSLIVGHLPHLNKLASLLVTDLNEKNIIKFQKAGLLCLERTNDVWQVKWYLVPQLLM